MLLINECDYYFYNGSARCSGGGDTGAMSGCVDHVFDTLTYFKGARAIDILSSVAGLFGLFRQITAGTRVLQR